MKRQAEEHSPGLASGAARDLDLVIALAAEKLPAFAGNRIVASNEEMWKIWEAIRVLAINLRQLKLDARAPKTGASAFHRGSRASLPQAPKPPQPTQEQWKYDDSGFKRDPKQADSESAAPADTESEPT